MYSKNLSASILLICDCQKLTYEAASELCDISPRHFGSIARGQTAASVNILEKLCIGLKRMPNELLGFTTRDVELSYRLGLKVTISGVNLSILVPLPLMLSAHAVQHALSNLAL